MTCLKSLPTEHKTDNPSSISTSWYFEAKFEADHEEINDTLLDTLAACGDVNRNVMSPANPFESKLHGQALDVAQKIHDHLTPQTSAYAEIWLDGEKTAIGESEVEPISEKHLPRKFKIAVALPPRNDVDVFSNCLGFVGIAEGEKIVGYNVLVGGGLGMTHGKVATFPRLADVIGFCTPEQVVQVAEEVVESKEITETVQIEGMHARNTQLKTLASNGSRTN